MLTLTIAGSGIFMLRGRIFCKPALISAETLSVAVMLVMVVGRALSGVHYLTDIFGGMLLSSAIVSLFAAFLPENPRNARTAQPTRIQENEFH